MDYIAFRYPNPDDVIGWTPDGSPVTVTTWREWQRTGPPPGLDVDADVHAMTDEEYYEARRDHGDPAGRAEWAEHLDRLHGEALDHDRYHRAGATLHDRGEAGTYAVWPDGRITDATDELADAARARAVAAVAEAGWERGPDVYRHAPEQQHHESAADLATGRDQGVDALLSSALDRPRPTAVLEHHDDDAAAGRDWRHHDHTAAVDVDRGDDLTR